MLDVRKYLKVRGVRHAFHIMSVAVTAGLALYAGIFLFSGVNAGKQPVSEERPRPEEQTPHEESKTWAGQVLSSSPAPDEPADEENPGNKSSVTHEKSEFEVNGARQVANILEIDLDGAEVRPSLSFGLIYGFEKLSDIVSRTGAYAAVNAGFFHEYGEPGGMVMADGEMYTCPTGLYPVLIVDRNYARLTEYSSESAFVSGDKRIGIHGLNCGGRPSTAVVYTPVYGTTNRAQGENLTVFIEQEEIIEIKRLTGESHIPRNGMLLTFYPPFTVNPADFPLKLGDPAVFEYSPFLGEAVHAYECGAWLLKDGKNVAPKSDPWVGVLTNRDPRTAVGVKDEGNTVVLVTVDGRQPGYSVGITAWELADFMAQIGVEDAGMLDGGASTEMIVNGRVVNRPNTGQERKIGGALAVFYKE